MRRIVLKIEYKGKSYFGWQKQNNAKTVQETIENAIEQVVHEKVKLVGSGRTDTLVSATGQIAHFDTESELKLFNLKNGINSYLKDEDISIKDIFEKDSDFDARKSAVKKTYEYRMYVDDSKSPLKEDTYLWLNKMPDVEKMNDAVSVLIGEKDFKCFCASNTSVKTTIRTIYSASFELKGDEIIFTICGSGFLYNMVRIIVGTLLDIGYGKKTKQDLINIIESKDRKNASKTISAKGLCLKSVEYGEEL